MPELLSPIVTLLCLCVTATAAVTDARLGVIPNRLTLPVIVAAPLAYLLFAGPGALLSSLAGCLLCGAIPAGLFLLGGMGGGDVKVLAALGALAGPGDGLRLQLAAFLVAGGFAIVKLIARGGLVSGLSASARALTGHMPKDRLEHVEAEHMDLRFGPPLLLATTVLCAMGQLP